MGHGLWRSAGTEANPEAEYIPLRWDRLPFKQPLASSNPHLYCRQVEYTKSAHIIVQNDLQGQLASECDGHRHISGTGRQPQFVRGTYASKGGKSFICLSST